MAHKCFISFKTEDMDYKKKIQEDMDIDMIDKSLDEPINSDDEDYIMRKIREDYLADSTVTIYLIGEYSAENSFLQDQTYIKRELQASVYKGYKRDKIEMRGDRAEMSDFPLYLNTVAGGLDRRAQTIGGFSFVVKIYAVPVVEIIR